MALIAGTILAPAAAFLTSPLWRRRGASTAGDNFSDAGALASVSPGTWILLPIEIVRQDGWNKTTQSRSVWALVKGTAPDDITVLSPICPHLGCPISWLAAKSDFVCPCHGSIFDADGGMVSGPSPRAMDRLEFQIREGHLWVRWQDFYTGAKDKLSVEV